MKLNHAKRRLGRPAKTQHLADNRVDSAHLPAHDVRQSRFRILFDQQVHERLDGHHGVLDLVRHAGRKRANAGQTIQMPQVFLQAPGWSHIVQHRNDSRDLAVGRLDRSGRNAHGAAARGAALQQ
jgi:hypothetical protein